MNSGRPDLSLVGSQINVVGTSHRPGSAKRANVVNCSASGAHRPGAITKGASCVNGNVGSGSSKVKGKNIARSSRTLSQRTAVASQRNDTSNYRSDIPGAAGDSKQMSNTKTLTAKDDFLALFESSTYTSKAAEKSQQRPRNSRPAWMTPPGSAHGTNTAALTSKTGKISHHAFSPPSSRSAATLADTSDHFAAKQNVNISTKSHQNKTQQSSRSREDGDLNLCLGDDAFLSHTSTKDSAARRSRKDSRSDSNEFFTGASSSHGETGRNMNSIANNMTSLAMSPGTKTSFLGLENSYQNLKPKTPINQVKQGVSREDRICQKAAVCIQRWYRRCRVTNAATEEVGIRRMLAAKRRELEEHREQEREQEREREKEKERREKDRVVTREEKARQARQRAIEELHQKREEKRLENQKKAEEEIVMLKDSGKVGRTAKTNMGKKGSKKKPARAPGSDSGSSAEMAKRQPATPGRGTCSVDDLFQQSTRHKTPTEPDRRTSNGLDNHARPHTPEGATSNRDGGADAPPSEAATNKTTLEDLMETLKKLEEEDVMTNSMKMKNQKRLDWLDGLEQPGPSLEPAASKDNLKKSSFLTDEKLRSIMTYLDEVETAERLTDIDQELDKVNKALERPALLVPSGEELAQMEQATATASEVTQNILLQKMELEEKKRSVAMLQKALSQQRELTVRHAKETEREMKQRLHLQKQEHEDAMKRHLSFIDQLIDDKKNLTEKCEKLVTEMKTVYKKYQDQMKNMQESHELRMKKEKELAAAAEKMRRERWIEEKTKKIKEMTVRGLEPEIQRLIAKHKAEIKKLKSVEQGEVLAADERAAQRYIKMTEELRDQLATEKEAACARERELARQTYEKQMQQEEEAYQQQRRRLYAEVQEEKERVSQQAMRQRTEIDRLQRQLEDSHRNAVTAMKTEYEQAREEQERRHLAEVTQLREQLALEKQAWEENYMKKKETWLLGKERELKDHVRRDRDREIEQVIQRLEEDNQTAREECERVAENRIKRIRDKYEKEIEELERSERQTREKYNTTKAKETELEGENQRLNVVLKQRDKEIVELKKLLDRLNEERSRVADVIRQEFANRLVATEEENKIVKIEMSELRARHQVELDRAKANIEAIEKAKDDEMEEVHKRVKQAILKKEEVVKQIQEQYQAAVKRADHLEGLLEQQRKQLLRR